MTIEEILINLGDRPVKECRYGRVVMTILKAYLPRGTVVSATATGVELLSAVYELRDEQVKQLILSKAIMPIRQSDPYRNAVLAVAVLIALTAGGIALWEINETSDYSDAHPVMKQIDDTFNRALQGKGR